jgi:hypothetical protein
VLQVSKNGFIDKAGLYEAPNAAGNMDLPSQCRLEYAYAYGMTETDGTKEQ